MTTQKQITANRSNAKKSTGPKTAAGKQTVAMNAMRHGVLSACLFIRGENPDDFDNLQDGLRDSLRPVGALELALVEKIAVALWKQRRLIASERMRIDMGTTASNSQFRRDVAAAYGVISLDRGDFNPKDDDQIAWCKEAMAEIDDMDVDTIDAQDLGLLKARAPRMYEQFCEEAQEEGETPESYLAIKNNNEENLESWMYELYSWCEAEIKRQEKRGEVERVSEQMTVIRSAPVSDELMARYQVTLDSELYRAMDQLRKQQEWRIKAGIDVEAEIVD